MSRCSEQDFGICADELARLLRDVAKAPRVDEFEEQPSGPKGPRREDDLVGEEDLPVATRSRSRLLRGEPPAAISHRFEINDLGVGMNGRACLFGEVEVVLVECVLRVVVASDHARTDQRAPGAPRACTTEIRVVGLDTRFSEVHGNRCRPERVLHAESLSDGSHHVICRRIGTRLFDAEHSLRRGVERRKFLFPVGDLPPLGVGVERVVRLIGGIRIDERSAADTRS